MHAAVVAAGSPGVVARESLPGVALITHRLLAFDVLRIRIRDRSFESRDIWREARPHEHLGDAVNMVGEIQDSNVIYNVRWDGMRWMVTRDRHPLQIQARDGVDSTTPPSWSVH